MDPEQEIHNQQQRNIRISQIEEEERKRTQQENQIIILLSSYKPITPNFQSLEEECRQLIDVERDLQKNPFEVQPFGISFETKYKQQQWLHELNLVNGPVRNFKLKNTQTQDYTEIIAKIQEIQNLISNEQVISDINMQLPYYCNQFLETTKNKFKHNQAQLKLIREHMSIVNKYDKNLVQVANEFLPYSQLYSTIRENIQTLDWIFEFAVMQLLLRKKNCNILDIIILSQLLLQRRFNYKSYFLKSETNNILKPISKSIKNLLTPINTIIELKGVIDSIVNLSKYDYESILLELDQYLIDKEFYQTSFNEVQKELNTIEKIIQKIYTCDSYIIYDVIGQLLEFFPNDKLIDKIYNSYGNMHTKTIKYFVKLEKQKEEERKEKLKHMEESKQERVQKENKLRENKPKETDEQLKQRVMKEQKIQILLKKRYECIQMIKEEISDIYKKDTDKFRATLIEAIDKIHFSENIQKIQVKQIVQQICTVDLLDIKKLEKHILQTFQNHKSFYFNTVIQLHQKYHELQELEQAPQGNDFEKHLQRNEMLSALRTISNSKKSKTAKQQYGKVMIANLVRGINYCGEKIIYLKDCLFKLYELGMQKEKRKFDKSKNLVFPDLFFILEDNEQKIEYQGTINVWPDDKTLKEYKKEGLITEEEYQQYIGNEDQNLSDTESDDNSFHSEESDFADFSYRVAKEKKYIQIQFEKLSDDNINLATLERSKYLQAITEQKKQENNLFKTKSPIQNETDIPNSLKCSERILVNYLEQKIDKVYDELLEKAKSMHPRKKVVQINEIVLLLYSTNETCSECQQLLCYLNQPVRKQSVGFVYKLHSLLKEKLNENNGVNEANISNSNLRLQVSRECKVTSVIIANKPKIKNNSTEGKNLFAEEGYSYLYLPKGDIDLRRAKNRELFYYEIVSQDKLYTNNMESFYRQIIPEKDLRKVPAFVSGYNTQEGSNLNNDRNVQNQENREGID